MARTKKEDVETLAEATVVNEPVETVAEPVTVMAAATEVTYELNGPNFTSVGDTFLSLCSPKVKIQSTDTALINSAEEQVKIGILKKVV